MDSRRSIANGFLWLGSSSALSSLVDTISTFAVLWFVTREDMGLATLAWSVTVFVEAFNGLGVSTAIVQAREVSRRQLSSLFWYVMGSAVALAAVVAALAPLLAHLYGEKTLTPMIIVAAGKMLLVGFALIPLQLLNRDLRYREVGMITAGATLVAALIRVGLAAAGLGAWALVLANVSNGAAIMVAVYLVAPFRPTWTFAFGEIREMAKFGASLLTASAINTFARNADYLLIGRFLGMAALGSYRVAFDLTMGTANSLIKVVNRAALPVYARVAHDPQELTRSFYFTGRSISLLLTGILAVVFVSVGDLLLFLGKGQWVEAAPIVRVLCFAAWLRCLGQTFPCLFAAVGKARLAIYDAVLGLVLLCTAFFVSLHWWGDQLGALIVGYAWLATHVVLTVFLWMFARTVAPLRLGGYLRALGPAFGGALLLGVSLAAIKSLERYLRPGGGAFAAYVITGVVVYGAYLRYVLGITPRSLFAGARDVSPSSP